MEPIVHLKPDSLLNANPKVKTKTETETERSKCEIENEFSQAETSQWEIKLIIAIVWNASLKYERNFV